MSASNPSVRFARFIGTCGLLWLPWLVLADGVDAQVSTSYSGSAAASGVQLTLTIPRFPVTDTPFAGGGPTAQAVRDASFTNQGYAAFPDPGQALVTVPSLIAGILSLGVGGLPPIEPPTLPDYPLYVRSDPVLGPEASIGDGPYQLRATSAESVTSASASAGFQTGVTGNVALVTSSASVTETPDGEVVAQAVSVAEGLSIGPLTIGRVRSTATMTLKGGSVAPTSSVEISGVKVAGLPLATFSADGLQLGGVPVPLPIPRVLSDVLGGLDITATIAPAQQFPDRVVAPAVQITGPATVPGFAAGTYTLTLGQVTAQMTTAVPSPQTPPSTGSTTQPSSAQGVSTGGSPSGSGGTTIGSGSTAGPPSVPTAPATNQSPNLSPVSVERAWTDGAFDIRGMYLVVATLGTGALIVAQTVRLLGVRGPWISFGG